MNKFLKFATVSVIFLATGFTIAAISYEHGYRDGVADAETVQKAVETVSEAMKDTE